MELFEKNCIPCKSNESALEEKEALVLLPKIIGWKAIENFKKLEKKFIFSNFLEAHSFVNAVVLISESEDHHPEISFGWGYVFIQIFTHKINGLHINDFILASKINIITI